MPGLREAPHPSRPADADLPLSVAEHACDSPSLHRPTPPGKRRRTTETRGAFPRKRAVAACDLCRLRKTKCDNQRPQCGKCAASGATCVFRDREVDHSAFDPASLLILDRLNHAIGLLEARPAQSAHQAVSGWSGSSEFPHINSDLSPAQSREYLDDDLQNVNYAAGPPGDEGSLQENHKDASTTGTDALNMNARCSFAYVLEWPVFNSRITPGPVHSRLNDSTNPEHQTASCRSSIVTDHAYQRSIVSTKSATTVPGDDTLALVASFLRNVHTKNPIFDSSELRELARDVVEDGFQWDAASCLVLVVCALGTLSMPWDTTIPKQGETSLADTESYSQAETYYNASRKRLGLLDSSMRTIQCWFLEGIYEMYSMRPMRAWLSFNRACTMFQLRLHTQGGVETPSLGQPEQRLYWSCLKSECEMREEFDLPATGLTQIEYLDAFPSPPNSNVDTHSWESTSRGEWESLDENSWYYYLSDLAYRRITNRTITTLFGSSQEQWLSIGVGKLHRITDELDKQIVQWWENIPGSPAPSFQSDMGELNFMLWLDYVDLRERVWRPFLFIAVHRELSEAEKAIVVPGARRCLDLCFDMLQGARLKHRHHGLWLTIRCMFTKALIVLAAAKSNLVDIRSDWREYIFSLQEYLRYWEAEAVDLASMRTTLDKLLEDFTD